MTFPLRSTRGAVPASVFAFALLLALVSAFTSGCDPNAATTLLVPTGSEDGCFSDVTSLRMVGDFTSPSFSIPVSPAMTLARVDGECVWQVTVRLNQGPVLFKFVTDEAFDNPTDYGGSESVTLNIPGGPHPTALVSGTGTAIKATVAVTGDYVVSLNEKDLTWSAVATGPAPEGGISGTVAFSGLTTAPFPAATVEVYAGTTRVASTTSDPTTRAFSIAGLEPGQYRVVASANCFATVEQNDVTVTTGVTAIGELLLTAAASAFSTIQMVGDFTTPPFNIPISPQMTPVPGSCSWTVTVTLPAGTVFFKFVTNGNFDTPPDYGGDETVTLGVPGGPHPTRLVTGTGTAIKINVAEAGSYTFTLNEQSLTWSAVAAGPPPGGGIAGSVAFAGVGTAPYPTARVEAFSGTTSVGQHDDGSDDAGVLARRPGGGHLPPGRLGELFRAGRTGQRRRQLGHGRRRRARPGERALGVHDHRPGGRLQPVHAWRGPDGPGADLPVDARSLRRRRDLVDQVPDRRRVRHAARLRLGRHRDVRRARQRLGRPVSGPGTNIRISVANSGTYRFILDEQLQRWEIQLVTPAPEVVR